MSKELNPSLRTVALQIALQLPDDQRQAISVLRYAREIVERGPKKLGHASRRLSKEDRAHNTVVRYKG